ncbi:uncharacterized protein LOC121380567 isoform X5 [Gigantopelta aegis]|nr:uncharacterized protein LOC121380567 isoform X5 [Gigantopelta aegis]XP_041365377.1 uncharacterized protein LOC121380567 isoform X5 [Gigantopelta aegis]
MFCVPRASWTFKLLFSPGPRQRKIQQNARTQLHTATCVEMRPTTEKACDGTTDYAVMKTKSAAKAKAECPYAGATAVKSSVVIMVSALFVSYLKF